ncbi:MAG: nucleotide pyrophosphohydrolase [Candidatus Aenigmarchaeota archaeon]|nr:nucleotide pyrophosphohydrolase [Candidatus Aenigmarchaeota archaeon]NIQ17252.1 nucleotide pyrophosphohydrolase [Candidatus Aenigmarchaeota archaeon]NIS73060.1 nucleotide pyrophosphohydrolase [Candidatus Aenigmarchaeota archaeon]
MPEEFESEQYLDFDKLKEKVRHFKRKRDWEEFEAPKDLAIAISVEASELLEMLQWMKENDLEEIKQNGEVMKKIKSELEDVVKNCQRMAQSLGIELEK